MKRRYCSIGHMAKQRKMKLVDMKVQNVEFFRELAYPVEHQHVIGGGVADIAVEAQGHGCAAHELCSANGVRAREQGHLVTQSDQFICKIKRQFALSRHKVAAARSP